MSSLGRRWAALTAEVRVGILVGIAAFVFIAGTTTITYSALEARDATQTTQQLLRDFHAQSISDIERNAAAEKALPAILRQLASEIAADNAHTINVDVIRARRQIDAYLSTHK